MRGERVAEITMEQAGDIVPELPPDGQVKPELVAQLGNTGCAGSRSGVETRGIGWHDMGKDKGHEGEAEQDGDQGNQPPGDQLIDHPISLSRLARVSGGGMFLPLGDEAYSIARHSSSLPHSH